MVATGTGIQDANMPQHLQQMLLSGKKSSVKMLPATKEILKNLNVAVGMYWSYGNAKLKMALLKIF